MPSPADASDASAFDAGDDAGAPDTLDAKADPFVAACANLHVLGCAEATDVAACTTGLRKAQTARLAEYSPACVAKAKDVKALRTCAPAWKNGCATH